jgi:phosphoglycerate kinase
MGNALEKPERPFVAIIGGAEVSDKIGVIENLHDKVDFLIIGGGMADTFLKVQGYNVGKSLQEEEKVESAKQLIEKAKAKGVELKLPIDVVVIKAFEADTPNRTVGVSEIQVDEMALDLRPRNKAGRKGMGQDGSASTLIGAISGFWLGQSTNEKPGANEKQGS